MHFNEFYDQMSLLTACFEVPCRFQNEFNDIILYRENSQIADSDPDELPNGTSSRFFFFVYRLQYLEPQHAEDPHRKGYDQIDGMEEREFEEFSQKGNVKYGE